MLDNNTNGNSSKSEDYYPDLFDRTSKKEKLYSNNDNNSASAGSIPQVSLYETTAIPQQKQESKHITIFGYSLGNRKNILEKINSNSKPSKLEEGKNFINIWCDDFEDLESLVKLNHSTFNGEIIGVYRNNFGAIKDDSIYKSSPTMFARLYKFFFGIK